MSLSVSTIDQDAVVQQVWCCVAVQTVPIYLHTLQILIVSPVTMQQNASMINGHGCQKCVPLPVDHMPALASQLSHW